MKTKIYKPKNFRTMKKYLCILFCGCLLGAAMMTVNAQTEEVDVVTQIYFLKILYFN
jgi:hypothetical protein